MVLWSEYPQFEGCDVLQGAKQQFPDHNFKVTESLPVTLNSHLSLLSNEKDGQEKIDIISFVFAKFSQSTKSHFQGLWLLIV